MIMQQLGSNSSGSAFAAWIQSDGIHDSVYANRYTPAGGWETVLVKSSGVIKSDYIFQTNNGGNYSILIKLHFR